MSLYSPESAPDRVHTEYVLASLKLMNMLQGSKAILCPYFCFVGFSCVTSSMHERMRHPSLQLLLLKGTGDNPVASALVRVLKARSRSLAVSGFQMVGSEVKSTALTSHEFGLYL